MTSTTFVTAIDVVPGPRDRGETLHVPARLAAPPVVAVVLAAGGGSRFRGPGHKLDAARRRSGRSSIGRSAPRSARASARSSSSPAGQLASDIHPTVVHVINERWADGQITSLRRGHRRRPRRSAPAPSSSGSPISRS